MKRFPLTLALLVPTTAAATEKETLETVTLQPQEKKIITIDSAVMIKLGWDHTDETASGRCQNNCENMIKPGGLEMASMHGAAMGSLPIDGQAAASRSIAPPE